MTRLACNDLLMVGQTRRSVTSPSCAAMNDRAANESDLRAIFIPDARDLLTGACCELPTGEVIEVMGRNTPFFALCRELEARGYGDCRIEISTPTGTPSMRAAVGVAAGLAISERDDRGLRMEKFRPFPGTRSAPGMRSGSFPTHTPQSASTRCTDSPAHEKAA